MYILAALIPYLAVAIGVWGIHSAWTALVIYHTGMLTVVLFSGNRGVCMPKQSFQWWMLPVGLIYSLGGIALYILWPYLGSDHNSISSRLIDYGINRHTWPYFAVYFCIVNSVLEELFWRGCLGCDTLRPVANDFLFGGYHALVLLAFASPVWAVPVFICTAFAGWLWRVLRSLSGGLTIAIITHIVADVSIAVAVSMRAFT